MQCWAWPVLVCIFVASPAAARPKRPPPVAVEARFKQRITAKLQASLSLASEHLAWTLGVQETAAARSGMAGNPGTFGKYELELAGEGAWRRSCETDIDAERDSVTLCALHKLQALTALCEVEGMAVAHRAGVMALLRQLLGRRGRVVPGLGVKRALLPVATGLEAWLVEKAPGSGEYDIQVAVQAAAMLAIVRCGSALGEREVFSDVQAWFVAAEKAYPRSAWDRLSFHSNSILLESFVLISTTVHHGSAFAEEIREFIAAFESYLQTAFSRDPKLWSFSGAHAAVLSWAAEKKRARRKQLGRTVDEYVRRWRAMAPGLNVSWTYTCGPLQGLAPLLLKQGSDAAELVGSVLRLAEKDVDLFQLHGRGANRSAAAGRLDAGVLEAWPALEGAFLRDEEQLRREQRWSLRIDDTAQCALGLARTLRVLEGLRGLDVPEVADHGAEAGSSPGSLQATGAHAEL